MAKKDIAVDRLKAAEKYANNNSRRWNEDGDIYYDHSKIMDAFIAGAEWQQEQMGEQARKELSKTDITLADLVAFDEGFKLGKRLERQDMLKDAVEGMITCANLNRYILVPKLDESLTYGHKVKIVIIPDKEDKK